MRIATAMKDVDPTITGAYSLDLRYTSNGDGGFEISVDDGVRGTLTLPSTQDAAEPVEWRQWHHWNEVVDGLSLELLAGRHLVRVELLAGSTNLDWIELRRR